MRPIVLRDEDPPNDAAVVVRGGLLSPKSVQRTVERCRREYGGFPHFSIVLPDLDVATLERLDACFSPPESSPALPDS